MSQVARPFVAVLLAAGEGSRLGSVPKSLMRKGDQTLLECQIVALSEAGASQIVVVTGHFSKNIEAELKRVQAQTTVTLEIVRNTQPERGQQSSVSIGLSTLATHHSTLPVLIALADQPLMRADDYSSCLHAFDNRPTGRVIMYPVVHQQRGNPVILTNQVMRDVLVSNMTCREYIHVHPESVHHFFTDCDHFVFDIDAPHDLEKFEQRTGIELAMPKK